MAVQIIMDHTGDRRHRFEPNDAEAVAQAERRFRELTATGFVAAERAGAGPARTTKSFNSAAEETLFFPQLVGG